MEFKGQLLLPEEPGPGLQVSLDIAKHRLAVQSEAGELGAWPLEAVEVRLLHGNTFAMTVAGEDLHFVADDTISFAYKGLPALEPPSRPRARSLLHTLFGVFSSDAGSANDAPRQSVPARMTPPRPRTAPEAPSHPAETPPVGRSREHVAADALPQGWSKEVDVDVTESVPRDPSDSAPARALDPRSDGAATRADPHAGEDPITHGGRDAADVGPPPTGNAGPGAIERFDGAKTADQERGADESPGCPAIRSDGRPCESQILTDSGYCYPHDPQRSVADGYETALRARARLRHKSTARLNQVYGKLDKAFRQVEKGELDPEVASAMAQLARTMCAILELSDEASDETEGGA